MREREPLSDAIAQLQDSQAHCVVIVDDDGRLKGLFTEEIILEHVLHKGLPPQHPLGDLIDTEVYSINNTATVDKAIDLMGKERLKYLPVCDGDSKPTGILSVSWMIDFLAELPESDSKAASDLERDMLSVVKLPVSFLLTTCSKSDSLCVRGEDPVSKALKSFTGQSQGAGLVYTSGQLSGLLRVRDIPFQVMLRDPTAESLPVSDFMSRTPEKIGESQSIRSAIKAISKSRILFLIYDNGGKVGLVSARDIMTYIYRHIHDDE